MGQRPVHDTFLTIVGAFVTKRRWTQAELARHADVGTEVIRKHLRKMKAEGWPLEETLDHPQIVWRVPATWIPGVLAFKVDELSDLLRVLARSPRTAARERVLKMVVQRLPIKQQPEVDRVAGPGGLTLSADEERWLDIIDGAEAKQIVVRMRYTTASRRDESTRHVSIHHFEVGEATRFLATCHKSKKLKWFRLSGVSFACLEPTEPFLDAEPASIEKAVRETVGGYREDAPPVRCIFFVRQPEATWVKRNLLNGMEHETVPGGIRVWIDTAAVFMVAGFVLRLGEAARPESPELAEQVLRIARGAVASAETFTNEG